MVKLIDQAGLSYFLKKIKEMFAAKEHSHRDMLPLSGGAMTGELIAKSGVILGDRQVRNVIISTEDPTESDGQDGDIWIVIGE